MSRKIKSLDDCQDGIDFTKWAEKRGADLRRCGGSHTIVITPRGSEAVPDGHKGPLGLGLKLKIKKRFILLGLGIVGLGLMAWGGAL